MQHNQGPLGSLAQCAMCLARSPILGRALGKAPLPSKIPTLATPTGTDSLPLHSSLPCIALSHTTQRKNYRRMTSYRTVDQSQASHHLPNVGPRQADQVNFAGGPEPEPHHSTMPLISSSMRSPAASSSKSHADHTTHFFSAIHGPSTSMRVAVVHMTSRTRHPSLRHAACHLSSGQMHDASLLNCMPAPVRGDQHHAKR